MSRCSLAQPPLKLVGVVVTRSHLATDIRLGTNPERVWEALTRSDSSPSWWRWLREVEVIDEGDERGVGARFRHQVGNPLLYRVSYEGEVTRAVEPSLAEFEASGDFAETGQFRLRPNENGGTDLAFILTLTARVRGETIAAGGPIGRHERGTSDVEL